jgi:hypothetical protein
MEIKNSSVCANSDLNEIKNYNTNQQFWNADGELNIRYDIPVESGNIRRDTTVTEVADSGGFDDFIIVD